MAISLGSSILILAGKVTAYSLTGSVALFSDAAESVVHLAATAFAAFSLWFASLPADANHPYGHGRIAYLSAGFEGALVLAAGVTVLYSGVISLIQGPVLAQLGLGLSIAGAVAVVNLIVGLSLLMVGRRHNSFILIANGKHVLTDVWTTVAAIIGLSLVMWTGLIWIDAVVALTLGLTIVGSGGMLLRRSLAGLMDEADASMVTGFHDALKEGVRRGLIADYHQMRCRQSNDRFWVEVHLLVPGDLTTREAHNRATEVEQLLEKVHPGQPVSVTTHIEPLDDKGDS
jgi:cation diffusion facilitator family transporter